MIKTTIIFLIIIYNSYVFAQLAPYELVNETFGTNETINTIDTLENKVYFVSNDRKKLWVHNLTENTTTALINSSSPIYVTDFTRFNEWTLFSLTCEYGNSIFRTKNTHRSTEKVVQVTDSFEDDIRAITIYNNEIYLRGKLATTILKIDSSLSKISNWLDLTELGGENSPLAGPNLFVLNNSLHFTTFFDNKAVLYTSNGNSKNIRSITDIQGETLKGIKSFETLFWNNKIYFSLEDDKYMIYEYDGISNIASSFLEAELNNYKLQNVKFNNSLVITLEDEINGFEPWIFNGTKEGTFLLKDINTNGNSHASNYKVLDSIVIFNARNPITGNNEYFETEGSPETTKLVGVGSKGLVSSNVTSQKLYELSDELEGSVTLHEYIGRGERRFIQTFSGTINGSGNFVNISDKFFLFQFPESNFNGLNNKIFSIIDGSIIDSPVNFDSGHASSFLASNSVQYISDGFNGNGNLFRVNNANDPLNQPAIVDVSAIDIEDICFSKALIEDFTTSVNKQEIERIHLYPNPTSGIIQIENKLNSNYSIIVTNSFGKTIERISITSPIGYIDINGYQNGLYFITVLDGHEIIERHKIVKVN